MKIADIKNLKQNDKVFWNDPDAGACSRIYSIKTIQVVNPEMIRITDWDDSTLECLPKELAPAKKYCVKVYWEMSAEHEVWSGNKSHAAETASQASLPPSGEWHFVPDSENVDEELDVQEIKA